MAVLYFNSYSLNRNAQKAYEPAVSNSGSVLNDCSRCNGSVFGLEVKQTTPNNYLNTVNPYGVRFHNPFSDYRFPKVLVRVIYRREPEQSESFKSVIKGLSAISGGFREKAGSFKTDAEQKRHFSSINSTGSDGERPLKHSRHGEDSLKSTIRSEPSSLANKTKAQQSDENILYTSQSGLRIGRVWSMAEKTDSQSINANHSPLDSTVKDVAGNGSSGVGRLSQQITSVVDSNLHQPAHNQDLILRNFPDKASQKAYERSEKRKAQQRAYYQTERGKALRKAYRQSEKGKASRKAYENSEKGKAVIKAYQQSESRKASRNAYFKTDRWKALSKAYRQSENGKAYFKAYRQSDKYKAYQRAYQKVLNSTGDKEQAKIAGRQASGQASAFIRKWKISKNNEPE